MFPWLLCLFLATALSGQPLKTVNIRSFGAVCDGAHDDAGAVEKAIRSLPPAGGEVIVPCRAGIGARGVTLTGRRNVTIRGQGPAAGFRALAISKLAAGGFSPVLILVSKCSGCSIRDLKFDAAGLGIDLLGIMSSTGVTVENNTFSAVGYANAALVAIQNTRNRYIRNTIFDTGKTPTDGTRGMWIGNLNPGETEIEPYIGQNVVHDVSATGIAVTAISAQIVGNTVERTLGAGIKIIQPSPGGPSLIDRNTVRHNLFHGLQIESVINMTISHNIVEQNDHAGIHLWKGFDHSVIRENTIRDNSLDHSGGWQGGIMVGSARDSVIENNLITDTRSGSARTQDVGIYIPAAGVSNLTIRDNVCTNHIQSGIHITNHPAFGADVDGVILEGNQCTGNSAYGLQIQQRSPFKILGIRLLHNTFDHNGKGAIDSNIGIR